MMERERERDYDFEPRFVSMNHSTGKKYSRKTTYSQRTDMATSKSPLRVGLHLDRPLHRCTLHLHQLTWQQKTDQELQKHCRPAEGTQKRATLVAKRLHCHRFTKGAAISEGVIAPFVVQTSRPNRIRIHHDRFRISGRPPSRQMTRARQE